MPLTLYVEAVSSDYKLMFKFAELIIRILTLQYLMVTQFLTRVLLDAIILTNSGKNMSKYYLCMNLAVAICL